MDSRDIKICNLELTLAALLRILYEKDVIDCTEFYDYMDTIDQPYSDDEDDI